MPRRGCLLSTNILPHRRTHTHTLTIISTHQHIESAEARAWCHLSVTIHFVLDTQTHSCIEADAGSIERIVRNTCERKICFVCMCAETDESIERFSTDCVGVANVCCGCLHQHQATKAWKKLRGLAIGHHEFTLDDFCTDATWSDDTSHNTLRHAQRFNRITTPSSTQTYTWVCMRGARNSCANLKSKRAHVETVRMYSDVVGMESSSRFLRYAINVLLC